MGTNLIRSVGYLICIVTHKRNNLNYKDSYYDVLDDNGNERYDSDGDRTILYTLCFMPIRTTTPLFYDFQHELSLRLEGRWANPVSARTLE